MDNSGGQFKENLVMILNTVSFFVKKAVRQERVYVFIILFKIAINCTNKFVGLYTTKLIVGEIAGRRELEKLVFLVLIILIVNMFTAFCDKLLVENLNRIGDKLERTLVGFK